MKMMNDATGIDDMSVSTPVEDDEDLVSKTKKWGSNFSIEEDKALVMTCQSVNLDPIAGTDQSMKTYWRRITKHCHSNVSVSITISLLQSC